MTPEQIAALEKRVTMLEQSIAKPPASKTPERPRSHIHFGRVSCASALSSRKNSIGCFCGQPKDETWFGTGKSSWK